jgi:hypothetical protein
MGTIEDVKTLVVEAGNETNVIEYFYLSGATPTDIYISYATIVVSENKTKQE